MKIDIRSDKAIYVEIDEWTFYIDNSTNDQMVHKWKTSEPSEYYTMEAVQE